MLCPLPVSTPIDRRTAGHRQPSYRPNLRPVIDPAVIFAPSRLLRVADKIGSGDVVMVADLAPAHAGEELFRAIRVDAAQAVGIVFIAVWAGFGSAALSQRVERHESFSGDSDCQTTQGKYDLSGKFNPTWSCHFEGQVIPGQYQQEAQTQQPPSHPQAFLSRAGVASGDWLGRIIGDPADT